MPNINKTITLSSWGGGSGPLYNAYYSTDNITFTIAISGSNLYLPSIGSSATIIVPDTTNYIKLINDNEVCGEASASIYTGASTTTTSTTSTTSTTTSGPTTTTTAGSTTTSTTSTSTTSTSTTTIPPNTFNVTNNGSGNYVINGVSNATLLVFEGQTYTFNINAVGHPFWIKTVSSTGTGNQYNTGVTNNGTDNGIITWVVSIGAPTPLYYNCQFHSSMAGTINVV